MDKKIIIWLGVVVVLFGTVWYLFATHSGQGGEPSPTASTTLSAATSTQQSLQPVAVTHTANAGTAAKPSPEQPPAPARVAGVNTVAYLLAQKDPLVCGVKTVSGVKRSGTMYVAYGQMRANLTSSASGAVVNTTMIGDGAYLYAWTNGAAKGLRVLAAPSGNGSAIAVAGGFDPAVNLSFACNPWIQTPGMFTPPSSVTFSNNP